MRPTRAPLRPLLLVAALLAAASLAAQPAAADDKGVYTATLRQAVALIPVAPEHTDGYKRTSFKHWVDADHDGCSTRQEVIQEESETPTTTGARCALTGGTWLSYYDDQQFNDPKKLDVDHVVSLLDVWKSGAYAWDAKRREAYANDLDDPRTLVAVSAQQNRSKGGKDIGTWLPSATDARCRYAGEWTAVKLRWDLTADDNEHQALTDLAATCPSTPIKIIPAA